MDDRIAYLCCDPSCPLHKTQTAYCQYCLVKNKHRHDITEIKDKLFTFEKDWNDLKGKVEVQQENVKNLFERKKDMISYLEGLHVEQ